MNNKAAHILDAIKMTVNSRRLLASRVVSCISMWAIAIVFMGAPVASAAEIEVKDSIRIYFKQGRSVYDPDMNNNRAVLTEYVERIKTLNRQGRLNDIVVEGYVSPDGPTRINERLARQRSQILAEIIEQQAGVDRTKIITKAVGVDWDELRRLIASTPDVPSRQTLLNIIDKTPIYVFDKQGNIIGGRKKSLMDLRGGRPYRWIYNHLFPEMRNATAITLSYSELPPEEPAPADSVIVEEVIPAVDSISQKTAEVDTLIIEQPEVLLPPEVTPEPEIRGPEILALKTNLLYYPILMPNVELEWMCAKQWSVALEWQGAWYAKEDPHKVYRLTTVLAEGRYWPIERKRWHGMYVGLFAGPGMYDLCNGKRGHEGEGAMVGVSAGYMWPITKHLSLEAGLGVGYLRVRDKLYIPRDGHYLYQLTKNINYVGPLRLKLSLVWRFWNEKPKSTNEGY